MNTCLSSTQQIRGCHVFAVRQIHFCSIVVVAIPFTYEYIDDVTDDIITYCCRLIHRLSVNLYFVTDVGLLCILIGYAFAGGWGILLLAQFLCRVVLLGTIYLSWGWVYPNEDPNYHKCDIASQIA